MSGRHSHSRTIAARAVVPIALLLILAVIVTVWRLASVDTPTGDDTAAEAQRCAEVSRIVAAPEVAQTVRAALGAADCDAEVEEATPGEVEQQVLRGQVPAVWVPDSGVWPARLAARSEATGVTPEAVGSIAASPVMVAASDSTGFQTWAEVIASDRTQLGNPLRDAAPALAMVGAQADAGQDAEGLQAALVGRAQASDPAQADISVAERLSGLGDGVTVVSEQQWQDLEPDLVAVVPGGRAPVLDYPIVVLGGDDERAAANEIAAAIAGATAAASVASAREEAGLRPPDLSGGVGGGVERIEADPEIVIETVTTWSTLTVPTSSLAVLDVSGSMNERLGEGRRLEVAVGAALVSLQLFSDRSSLGLWEFGVQIGPNQEDYRELVPIEALDTTVDGVTQRERIVAAAQQIRARPGVGTGLYDTVLAAYRETLENYRADAVNSVIVITDGRNEDPGSIELAELLETLRAEADPERPVAVYTIGISEDADADALAQIAQATGGSSHVAADPGSNPAELADLFRSVVAGRQVVPAG